MRLAIILASAMVLAACSGDDEPVTDAGGSTDAGSMDAGGGMDAGGTDAGAPDAGPPDDAGPQDGAITFACTLDELRPIVDCATMNCISLPDASLSLDGGLPDASLPDPGELGMCIALNCATLLLGVSPSCRDCLIAGVGMNLDEIRMRCADGLPIP